MVSNFSKVSERENVDEDEDVEDEEDEDVIVSSFDWELSRLSIERSLSEKEIAVDGREIGIKFEQRLRTNGQRNDGSS